jgi:hypothetical protein
MSTAGYRLPAIYWLLEIGYQLSADLLAMTTGKDSRVSSACVRNVGKDNDDKSEEIIFSY